MLPIARPVDVPAFKNKNQTLQLDVRTISSPQQDLPLYQFYALMGFGRSISQFDCPDLGGWSILREELRKCNLELYFVS